jgi:lysophospholipase L1-like esterase
MIIVAFGDSITAANHVAADKRWVELVNTRFKDRGVHVINSGVGGNTTREGLARIREDVLAHKPDMVLIEFGGNDATPDPARHVSLDEFEANLRSMQEQITASNGARIILLTFPPVIDDWHAWKGHEFYAPDGADAYVEKYRQVTRDYASAHGIALVDIDKALRQAVANGSVGQYILSDGIHLTEEGHAVVAEAALGVL